MADLITDNPTRQEGGELEPRIIFVVPSTSRTSENPTHSEEDERVARLVIPLPTPCGEEKKTLVHILLPYEVENQFLNAKIEYTPPTKRPPAITPNEYALRSLIRHQRFRQPNWSNIRYSEVKDQFQASPGFCALKPNALLSGITPDLKCNAILSRFDLTLGAVLNGLLKNMMIFHEILNNMPENMKMTVSRAFLTVESKYRQKFDSLLQYVCGRRQELIQQRRELYKPPSKILRKALYGIPPSETHLFEDEAFKQFVQEVGGIDMLFPTEERQGAKPLKRKANQYQQYGKKHKATQNHQ